MCTKLYIINVSYCREINLHASNSTHLCTLCNRTFAQNYNLNRHMRTMHPCQFHLWPLICWGWWQNLHKGYRSRWPIFLNYANSFVHRKFCLFFLRLLLQTCYYHHTSNHKEDKGTVCASSKSSFAIYNHPTIRLEVILLKITWEANWRRTQLQI